MVDFFRDLNLFNDDDDHHHSQLFLFTNNVLRTMYMSSLHTYITDDIRLSVNMSGIIIMFEPDEMMMKRVFFLLLMFAHKQNMQAVRSIQAGSLNLSAFTSYMMMMMMMRKKWSDIFKVNCYLYSIHSICIYVRILWETNN